MSLPSVHWSTDEPVGHHLGALKTVRDWKALSKSTQYKGHDLFYVDSGKGPVILCLQGFPLTSWSWGRIWPRLSHHRRMLSFDRLGTGYSDKPDNYLHSVIDEADQVESLLQTLEIKQVTILAHGSGATVAEELLARQNIGENPGLFDIERVVFLNGGIVPSYQSPFIAQIKQMIERRPSINDADEILFGRMLNTLCDEHTHLSRQFIHESWFLLKRKDGLKSMAGLLQYLADRESHAQRWESVLRDSTVPIDCVIGMADPAWGRDMIPTLRKYFSRENIHRLADVGNYPHLEAPHQVIKHIDALIPV